MGLTNAVRRGVWEVRKKSRIFLDFASTRGAARGGNRSGEEFLSRFNPTVDELATGGASPPHS